MAADTVSGFLGPINNFINNLGLGLVIGIGAVMTVQGMATCRNYRCFRYAILANSFGQSTSYRVY